MSDPSFGGTPSGQSSWMPPPPVQKPSQVPLIIAIVVALLALGLAASAFFKPKHDETPAAPQYSDQQVADAKKTVCDAYDTMYKSLQSAGSLTSDNPDQKFMLALNTRIAFNTSADYIMATLDQHPATPKELEESLRNSADSFRRMILAQIADAPKNELDSIYSDEDAGHAAVKTACK